MSAFDRVLITGGKGMLAGALSHALRGRGVTPLLLDRAALDVTDARSVGEAFRQYSPTLVLNCAAYTKVDQAEQEPDAAERVNGAGPANLAEHCARDGAKLVHYSTDYVFDGTLDRPLRPDDPVGPQSAYGRSKLSGERALQHASGLDYLLIRTAWLYGMGGSSFVKTMVTAANAGKLLRVVDDQHGSPTYTADLAAATLNLLDRDARGTWHLTNAGETTWYDFARAIFEEWDLHPDLLPTTSEAWKAGRANVANRPGYSVLDIAPYEQLIGRPMRPWREALRDFRQVVERTGGF